MPPAALVNILTAGGFGLRLDGGRLIVHPADTLTDDLRTLIRDHKAALVGYLSRTQARRLWLIHHADGRLVSHSFTPPASREEVAAWYPLAHSIEPEEVPRETPV